MTKCVRIENADQSDYKVVVEVWDKGQNGEPDVKANEITLGYPTSMAGADGSLYLTNSRYIVVKEIP